MKRILKNNFSKKFAHPQTLPPIYLRIRKILRSFAESNTLMKVSSR